jgi:hypothetical protein
VVNTQLVNPLTQTSAAVKASFPAVTVKDQERANVRPPNPSLCVGNGFVIEVTDLVRMTFWPRASPCSGIPLHVPITVYHDPGSLYAEPRLAFQNFLVTFFASVPQLRYSGA